MGCFGRKRKAGTGHVLNNHEQSAARPALLRAESSKGQLLPSEKSTLHLEDPSLRSQAYLPQAADNRTIHIQVKVLYDQIELHVDKYYRKSTKVKINEATRQALTQLDTGELPVPLEQLLKNSRTALPVIKHCIAGLLIRKITPAVGSTTSLLPRHLSERPTKLQASNLSPDERQAAEQTYSQWKPMSSYLYPKPQDDRSYKQARTVVANEIHETLSTAFSPWEAGESGNTLRTLQQHEGGVITTASTVGILLASQPSTYEFRWTEGGERSKSSQSLVVLPGLWRTSDAEGRPLERPQLLVAPVTARK